MSKMKEIKALALLVAFKQNIHDRCRHIDESYVGETSREEAVRF
jgi:hypothetical protein